MRHWFWSPTASTPQKWLICVLLAVLLGAVVPMLSRSFVPSVGVVRTGLVMACALTLAGAVMLRRMYLRGQWQPGGPWREYSTAKRLLLLPLCVAFFVFVLWLCVAMTLPMLYTRITGAPVERMTTAEKKASTGRRSCRHQLQIEGVAFWWFEFCIDGDDFDALPAGPLPAALSSLRSPLGEYIHTVTLHIPRHGLAPADGAAGARPHGGR